MNPFHMAENFDDKVRRVASRQIEEQPVAFASAAHKRLTAESGTADRRN